MKQQNGMSFWWDGGFESVHNRPNRTINPNETAHIGTDHYRLDISRKNCSLTGIALFPSPEDSPTLRLPEAEVPLHMCFTATVDGNDYSLCPERDPAKSLMVYDAGRVCHQLRHKGCGLYASDGQLLEGIEVELTLFCWEDFFALSMQLVYCATRQPVLDKNVRLRISFSTDREVENHANSAWLQGEKGGVLIHGSGSKTAGNRFEQSSDCETIHSYWEILRVPEDTSLSVQMGGTTVYMLFGDDGTRINGYFDAFSGCWILPLPDRGETSYSIRANTVSAQNISLRLMLLREGIARLQGDGTVLPYEITKGLSPMGVYAYGYKSETEPSDTCWQISVDGHEFENFPRPYTHKWIHLYSRVCVSAEKPFGENVIVGFGALGTQPAASFTQLSLLGWDDNPHYGNEQDRTAVQLWIQGLIGVQEILCICPESHMTDCTITDIRAIDAGHNWGYNNGGGDFLRFRTKGNTNLLKMCAARCRFLAYGPLIGTLELSMVSEDAAITGVIRAYIYSAKDVARVIFRADYEVQKAMELDEITLAWLGCPGYDRSRYAKYAWGIGGAVMEDARLLIENGPDERLIQTDAVPNSWYCAYGGGIIDEQYREPNANKALILREWKQHFHNYNEVALQAKHVCIDAFDGLTSQFWLGIHPESKSIRMEKGDTMHLVWEYVPTVKYARDCAPSERCVWSVLRDNPDSYALVRMIARDGWEVSSKIGVVNETWPIPMVTLDENDHGYHGQFHIRCGIGYMPLQCKLTQKPGAVKITVSGENSSFAHTIPYQIHKQDNTWIISVIIKTDDEILRDTTYQCELTIDISRGMNV